VSSDSRGVPSCPPHVARAIVLTWLPNVIIWLHSAGGPSNSKVVVQGARDSIFAGSAVARAARTGTAGRWSSSYAASSGVRKVSLSVDPHRRNKILLRGELWSRWMPCKHDAMCPTKKRYIEDVFVRVTRYCVGVNALKSQQRLPPVGVRATATEDS
jgi:hypothetical protein